MVSSLVFFEKLHIRSIAIFMIVYTIFKSRVMFEKLLFVVALSSIYFILKGAFVVLHDICVSGIIRTGDISFYSYMSIYYIPFILIAVASVKSRWAKTFWIMFLLTATMLTCYSGSRGAILGLIGIYGILLFLLEWREKLKVVLIIIFVVGLFIVSPARYARDHYSLGFDGVLNAAQHEPGMGNVEKKLYDIAPGRMDIIKDYLVVIRNNLILGVGGDINSMRKTQEDGHLLRTGRLLNPKFGVQFPHNTYLFISLWQGVLGLSIFITMLLVSIWFIKRSLSREIPDYYRRIGIMLMSSHVGVFMISGIVRTHPMMTFMLIFSLTAIYLKIVEELEQPKPA